MRVENERRLKELEEIYLRKKENSQVGKIIRDRMGYSSQDRKSTQESPKNAEFDRDEGFDQDATYLGKKDGASGKKK